MEAAGQDTVEAGAKLKEWKSKERDFLRQTGLKESVNTKFAASGVAMPEKMSIIGMNSIVSGARITNVYSKEARQHAERYYGLVRSMSTDAARIAKNTGFSETDVILVKKYLFTEFHDLGGKSPERFAPDFAIAESWQRLIDGKPEEHDLTLLKHEIRERQLVLRGMSQYDAHIAASKEFNYSRESDEFYATLEEHRNKK